MNNTKVFENEKVTLKDLFLGFINFFGSSKEEESEEELDKRIQEIIKQEDSSNIKKLEEQICEVLDKKGKNSRNNSIQKVTKVPRTKNTKNIPIIHEEDKSLEIE